MNSVLLWIGGLLIAALGLLFAVPSIVDWNSYRGVFEEEASRLLGRDVRVGGKVALRLLPAPYVRFEKVRISDSDATLGESFFRAESFTLWLSAMPLLRGAIEANEIELDRPVLRLAFDAAGNGNWQSLRRTSAPLQYVPNDVVLQQIKVRNGTVSLKSHDRAEPAELTGIDGEVSATALAGPYRFRGQVVWHGIGRELRVAISPQEPDGHVRFRTIVRVPETNNSYTFDGGLSELTTRALLDGTLTARLPIPAAAQPAASPPAAANTDTTPNASGTAPRPRGSEQNAFDLKASVLGNFDSVKLSDIELAFEQDGKPQLVSGEATANWRGGQRMEARLSSRWLDLDRITGDGATRPVEAARELLERIGAMLPTDGTTFATLDVDQVNLGGEALSGLRLALARAAGRTSIGELKAGLPGNARATIRGVLGANGDTKSFEGEVVLRGSSYQRFSAWAGKATNPQPSSAQVAPTSSPVAAKGDGAFSLASRMKMVPGRLELLDASVEFAGAQLQGDLDWRWVGQRELRVSIDGATVDVSALAPGLLDFESWRGARRGAGPSPDPSAAAASPLAALGAKARLVNAAVGNLRVAVRAQTLTDGVNKLRDVDANLSFEPDALVIPGLKFVSPDGVQIDLQGEIKALETKPNGRLKGWLSAKGGASVQALASALAAGDTPLKTNWAVRASRVDLGFSAVLGGPGATTRTDQLSVRANGTVDDGRLDLSMTLLGGINGWREAPVDLALSIDSPEMPNLVRRIVAGREPAPGVVGPDNAQGTLLLKVVGPSAAALQSFVQLDANGLGLSFNGRATLASDDTVDIGGDLSVAAADTSDLFTLLGATHRPAMAGIGIEGALGISRDAGRTTVDTRGLSVGGSRMTGKVVLASKGDRLTVDGQLVVNQASIPAALGLVLDGRDSAGGGDIGQGSASSLNAAWPETAFAFGVFDSIEGRIAVTTPDLEIANGLAVSDAELLFEMEPGRVALSKLTGKALGGQLTARSSIERAPGGAKVTLDGRLAGARIGELMAPSMEATNGANTAIAKPAANLGDATIDLKLEGRGANPRAVFAAMNGRGEVELRNARVRGIAPGAIDKTAQLLIEGQTDINRVVVEQTIRNAFVNSEIDLATRKLPIEVVDGAVKIGTLQIETADARIRNQTVVDLAGLKLDSEWQIAPRRVLPARPVGQGAIAGSDSQAARTKAPLPPITLVWSGPIAQVATLAPRLSIETLEREITVRKMERDVERLEELRRQDQERARQEAERLRNLDEQAQGPGAAASSLAPPVIQAPFPIQAAPAQGPRNGRELR